ncbi:MAG TPA: amidohydrolase [Gemmatimonadales bacterium]|nr:amidohydrolase [Gemmatimonadales bacterium]
MKSSLRGAFSLALLAAAACSPAPKASIVIYGKVWTGDSARPAATAVAIAGDTIVAVGDSAAVAPWVDGRTEVVRTAGLVTPGFADGHTHFIDGGFQLGQIDLRDARTPDEFIRRIAAYARTQPKGAWILGGDWDHEWWPGGPLPTRSMIDSVTPDNPVFITRLDGHMALANTAAITAAKLAPDVATPAGGVIVRDAQGAMTGIFKDNAQDLIYPAIPARTPEQNDSALARALRYVATLGVTSVAHVSAGWGDYEAYRRADARGAMTARVTVYPPLGWWHAVADTVRANGNASPWVRMYGVKGYVDGSLGSTTALLYGTYLDDRHSHGQQVTSTADLRSWITSADSAGLQVVVHAIGDSANGLLLSIYDSVAKLHGPRDRRFRIEHAQHLNDAEIAAIARQHVIASMQPYHLIDDGRWAWKRLDAPRLRGTYAFRALLDSGAVLAFGSDWTVATIDPLWGIYAAVTRRTLDDKNPGGWIPAQKISVEEALRAYTAGNAYGVFREHDLGVLAPGRLADVAVIDRDLFTMPAESLATARVAMTIAGGKVVFRR